MKECPSCHVKLNHSKKTCDCGWALGGNPNNPIQIRRCEFKTDQPQCHMPTDTIHRRFCQWHDETKGFPMLVRDEKAFLEWLEYQQKFFPTWEGKPENLWNVVSGKQGMILTR